jgi:hypothetical protein
MCFYDMLITVVEVMVVDEFEMNESAGGDDIKWGDETSLLFCWSVSFLLFMQFSASLGVKFDGIQVRD